MNLATMTTSSLVNFYNQHSDTPVKKFRDRATAERRVAAILSLSSPAKVGTLAHAVSQITEKPECVEAKTVTKVVKPITRPKMVESLKLDRTITCIETGEVWKNAYTMWIDNPEWMTTAQQDRLTAQLYAAAKIGEQKLISINGRTFKLVNVKE